MAEAATWLEREVLRERTLLADVTAAEAWRAFVRFGGRPFDVPATPDSDGLLFQYGIGSFDGPPAFLVNLTRQFGISGENGDHDHYVQVHCELRYRPTPALEVLGTFHSWFFRDEGGALEEWAGVVSAQPVWATIGILRPVEIVVYQEQV